MKKIPLIVIFLMFSINIFSVEFEANIAGYSDAEPLVIDIDNNGIKEVIVCMNDGTMHLFTCDGNEIINGNWPVYTSSPVSEGLCVLEDDKEKKNLIAGTYNGKVYSFGLTGQSNWEKAFDTNTMNLSEKILAAPEVDNNEKKIYFSTTGGHIYIIDMEKNMLWHRLADAGVSSSMHLTDINGDGVKEFVFKSDKGTLHVYDNNLDIYKGFPVSIKENDTMPYPLTVEDIDGNNTKELIFATNSYNDEFFIYSMDISGKVLNKFSVSNKVFTDIKTHDVDKDGIKELVFNSLNGYFYIKKADGKDLDGFPLKTGNKIKGSPIIYDTDGDGISEYLLVSSEDGINYSLIVYDNTGRKLDEKYLGALDSNMFNDDIMLADLDRSGSMELIFLSDGKLKCVETDYVLPVRIKRMGTQYDF